MTAHQMLAAGSLTLFALGVVALQLRRVAQDEVSRSFTKDTKLLALLGAVALSVSLGQLWGLIS